MQQKVERNLRKETIMNHSLFYHQKPSYVPSAKSKVKTCQATNFTVTPNTNLMFLSTTSTMNPITPNPELNDEEKTREKVSSLFYSIHLLSKSFSLWKFCSKKNMMIDDLLFDKHATGTLEQLEKSLEKYEKISTCQLPHSRTSKSSFSAKKELTAYKTVMSPEVVMSPASEEVMTKSTGSVVAVGVKKEEVDKMDEIKAITKNPMSEVMSILILILMNR